MCVPLKSFLLLFIFINSVQLELVCACVMEKFFKFKLKNFQHMHTHSHITNAINTERGGKTKKVRKSERKKITQNCSYWNRFESICNTYTDLFSIFFFFFFLLFIITQHLQCKRSIFDNTSNGMHGHAHNQPHTFYFFIFFYLNVEQCFGILPSSLLDIMTRDKQQQTKLFKFELHFQQKDFFFNFLSYIWC